MKSEQPDAEMIGAADAVARFISTGDEALLAGVFAEGEVTILENFAPFLFIGPGAVAAWAREMGVHAQGLTDLRHSFEPAFDFGRAGEDVFFSLPTTWRGASHGKAFTETGGWSFLLTQQSGRWRIRAYGWAVTGLRPG